MIKEKMEEENEKNKKKRLENRTFLQRRNLEGGVMSRLQKEDFVSFYFLFHFYFLFNLFFIFSIFKTLGLGLEVTCHTVTSVTSDGVVTILIMELKRKK